jgi:putative FmdB family regulatory protein
MEVRGAAHLANLVPERYAMPIYAFRCRGCGCEFEEWVPRIGQTAPCPQCGQKDLERLVTAPAAGRRGSGGSAPGCEAAPPDCGFS